MANLAIIPARGGSKRIKKKNIKDFNGKPILAYVIDTAIKSALFDEVIVSTDDDEIAEVALTFNAKVPFRRSVANSDDHATLADVLLEVIEQYRKLGKEFDAVCCILPTAALISKQRLMEGYKEFTTQNMSSLVPVLKFAYPIQRALMNNHGLLNMREPQYLKSRSQDLEPHYHDSGQFYWIKTSDFLQENTVFMKKTGFIELKETEAQDVDTLLDWEMLHVKYNYQQSTANEL